MRFHTKQVDHNGPSTACTAQEVIFTAEVSVKNKVPSVHIQYRSYNTMLGTVLYVEILATVCIE